MKSLLSIFLLVWTLVHTVAAAPAKSAAKLPADPGWPRDITRDGIKLTVYQPQIDEWNDYRELKARTAFVMTTKDQKPVIGIANLEGMTTADAAARTVFIKDLKIASARFPSLPDAEVPPMEALLKKTFPGRSLTVSLDRLAAGVERNKNVKPVDLKMDPPKIFVSARPAILLVVEGKPVRAPVAGTKLEFVVNANWDLLFDPESAAYYLLTDKVWLTCPTLEGEWALASQLPAAFSKLPKGEQWDNVKKAVPPKVTRGMVVPYVSYSSEPAELIAFESNPVWEEVTDTELLWAKNTESWVFEDTRDRQIYFLVSGRWFSAPKWEGPWTFASGKLPEDFKKISPDSACADVLASVPGTSEAEDAVMLAQVPQEAVVKRKDAEAKAKVVYDGEPKFEPVKGTQMTYATNTSSDVIFVENKYYLCQDAVWFVAAAAIGPWTVCVEIPKVIHTIPPECPVYRVTYVNVTPGDSDDVVVCSYTAGYFGAFVAGVAVGAALVWGTGYNYPPVIAYGGPVPIYRPWPATYGAAAAYNPWTGGYAVGGRVCGPYASAGRAAWYNPATGNYGRAAHVSGPYGSRTAAAGYNPRTDTAWATRQGSNGYAQWGTSAVRRGDDWVRAGHVATDDGGVARWKGSEGGGRAWKTDNHSGGVAYHDGDVYAGRDGNVYRRDDDGQWAKYDHGDWESIDHRDKDDWRRNDGTRPGENGGGVRKPLPGDNTRPGANGEGERRPLPGDNTRPGADGGGVRKPLPGDNTRPGANGEGERRPLPGDNTRPGANGEGERRPLPGDNTRPGADGGGVRKPLPGDNTRPGANGEGERRPLPGDNTRPGSDGGGVRRPLPGDNSRPGADGGGERRFQPGGNTRPGGDGGGQRFNPGGIENRPAARRAEAQPSDDITNRLSQEAAGRNRGEFNNERRNEFQRQSGGGATRSFGDSRSFGGGGGGGGGHSHGGGLRRR